MLLRERIDGAPPPERREVVARPEVVQARLEIPLLPREPLLRASAERPPRHQEPHRLVVVALQHGRAIDHGPRRA